MKKLIMTAAFAVVAGAALAQSSENVRTEISTNKYKVETNSFWDNWFISAGAGAQMYFGDFNRYMDFGDRITPAFDFAIGKWFTPGIGVRAAVNGMEYKGFTRNGAFAENYDGPADWGDMGGQCWKSKQKYFHMHGDVLFNVTNMVCGYSETRVWNFIPYAGLGWIRAWQTPQQRELTGNIGILNTFRLASCLDLQLDAHAYVTKDRFDGEGGGRLEEGALSVTLGLAYKFPKRSWDRGKVVYVNNDAELADMQARLDAMQRDNDELRRQLAEARNNNGRIDVKKFPIAAPNLIIFKINTSILTGDSRVNLGFLAEVMKQSDQNQVYTITGYADKGTGTKAINDRLSKERATAVYNCLVNEFGVPASMLTTDSKGGVEDMFYNDPRLSRAVITRAAK